MTGRSLRRLARWGLAPLLCLALAASAAAATITAQSPPAATGTTTTATTTASTGTSTSTTATTTTTTSTTTTTTTPVTLQPAPRNHSRSHRHRSSGAGCRNHARTHRRHRAARCPAAKHPVVHHPAHGRATKPPAQKPGARPTTKGSATPSGSTSTSTPSLFTLPLVFTPSGSTAYLIDSFQIPPFLLPIYQAAGIQYDVPWQVLAAINWIETDYGRNLSVSSAGAVGWMQFLPSTWKEWGVDATGSGFADPYNPVDAIFAAARYLQAAGAAQNLSAAVYAYNHAGWYVHSVLLRAKLIESLPGSLLTALSQMVEGRFPVIGAVRYHDSGHDYTNVAGAPDAGVVAVNDGTVVAIGHSARLGHYVKLRDAAGNLYTYAHLGRVDRAYVVPKPDAVKPAPAGQTAPGPRPNRPASAGTQSSGRRVATAGGSLAAFSGPTALPPSPGSGQGNGSAESVPLVKERLFAHPWRAASYAAGGDQQVAPGPLSDYLSTALHLRRGQYVLRPLHDGSVVVAGTILGHLSARGSLRFMIEPAGRHVPAVDPKPILDGWKLLAASALFHRAWSNPDFGPGASNPTIGQELLMSKSQLGGQLLADPKISLGACGRRDVEAGVIDRRVLAAVGFLGQSGLDPTLAGLPCGAAADRASEESVNITAVNGTPVLGHQQPGGVADQVIRRLLTLQGAFQPAEITSLRRYAGQPDTLSLPDHAGRIQVSYARTAQRARTTALSARQWQRLIGRLGRLPEPAVPIGRSRYAFAVRGRRLS